MTSKKPIAIDPDDFQTFTEVAKGLPHIKPRVVQALLRDLHATLSQAGAQTGMLGDVSVTRADLEELYHTTLRTGYATDVVSPAGARLLVRLYSAGALPMQSRKAPGDVAPSLQEYCDSEPALRARAQERVEKRAAYAAKVANPASIVEADFTWGLLNDVFWKQGQDVRELLIDGRTVHKSLYPHVSNSGKSRDFTVRFTWTAADGTKRELEKTSIYEGNRRNDEERNWGLPE